MNNESEPQTVLVTGGSGYLGSWMIVALLQRGFVVRTTVRDQAREAGLRQAIETQIDPSDNLTVYVADLLNDEGWAQAAEGADSVIHVASPMPVGEFKGQDILTPAREGTRRVLEVATAAGVKRVVMTSSAVAALPPIGQTRPITEDNWTSRPDKPAFNYLRAKTSAERDAWAFVKATKDTPELTTILPGFIQGPVMSEDYSGSVDLVAQMLQGKMPAVPKIGFHIVDVRDLAELHIKAMLSSQAAGQRFLAAGDFLWLIDFANILRENFADAAAKAPKKVLPDWLVRLLALVNKDMASIAPDLGIEHRINISKAQRMLDWTTRPAKQSIVDGAASLLSQRLV
jgi:dihydroflavonol-4-reductase